jgi:hypothetical protein
MARGFKTGGRQKGTPNKKTRELQERTAAEGITPLEVMLKSMRAAWARNTPKSRMEACALAKDAAPYIHPRLVAQAPPKTADQIFEVICKVQSGLRQSNSNTSYDPNSSASTNRNGAGHHHCPPTNGERNGM